jgi:hypothetical protein
VRVLQERFDNLSKQFVAQGVQVGRLRTELYYAISEARKWADAEGYDISDKLKRINDRLEVDL